MAMGSIFLTKIEPIAPLFDHPIGDIPSHQVICLVKGITAALEIYREITT
jgi:hypothetical protein